ncbi:MAG: adenylosuccinate lyase [Candidatus Komeilibacteria bacterium]|nr:adenylosuccinate lyase [Candidatus Komeilibacteria bacterium]
MIERYSTKAMSRIWAEKEKFNLWLKLELAVLEARAKLGQLDQGIVDRIRRQAKFSLKRIAEIEAVNHHDLLAFVQAVRENLDPDLRGRFHEGLTSYDTEEIPFSLRLIRGLAVVEKELNGLWRVLTARSWEFKDTPKIGRTHCQHAEPITFGVELLNWSDLIGRDLIRLKQAKEVAGVGKISGAVGVYGDLDPAIEDEVCRQLGLRPTLATQILHRDRLAQVMTTLAIVGSDLEHIALNLRLMSQTEVGEIREPFGQGQKGSSRMPHKKNPIVLEKICGLSRLLRGYAVTALETVATWSQRDISQSSPERIIVPDGFHAVHHMIQGLSYIVANMEVFPDQMLLNLQLTQGCIFSGAAKEVLLSWGVEPELAYKVVQQCSFQALAEHRPLLELLQTSPALQPFLAEYGERNQLLADCFDVNHSLRHIQAVFDRFGPDANKG